VNASASARYDRALLLTGAKRTAILDLREVQRYGADSFGDADYVSIYGMRPDQWHAKGVRLMGRTAVECTRDALADAIGRDVARIAGRMEPVLVIDAFAWSGSMELTRRNLGALGVPIQIHEVVLNAAGENHGILLGTPGWRP